MCERKGHGLGGLPSGGSAAMHENAGVSAYERREKAHYRVEKFRMAGYGNKAHHSARTAVYKAGFSACQVLDINCRSNFGSGAHTSLAVNLECVGSIYGLDFKYLFLFHIQLTKYSIYKTHCKHRAESAQEGTQGVQLISGFHVHSGHLRDNPEETVVHV